ncbi:MAG: VWA domain-containing protein [Gammaproteobacteria bacterium]
MMKSRNRIRLNILVSIFAAISAIASAAEFFVSPEGNDSNSGTRAEPFATIAHARDAVRGLSDRNEPITVYLREGTHYLPETLVSRGTIPAKEVRALSNGMLDQAVIGIAGKATAIGDAIGLAVKRLQHYPHQSRVLILLTDGANDAGEVSPILAAKLAAKEHIRIYTIGVGADRMLVQGFFGNQVAVNPSSDLDAHALRKIASVTGGKFFRAKNTRQLREIYHELDKLEPTVTNRATFRPFTALYMWPLGLALLISLAYAWLQLPATHLPRRKPATTMDANTSGTPS